MPSTGIKKQKRFSHRRHISKPRKSLGSVEREKRQSSLTQLDFVSTPQTNEIITLTSDEDEDGDFVVEQPRKKRRVSAKGSDGDDWTPRTDSKRSSTKRESGKKRKSDGLEKGQQTMTQIDFVPSSHRSRVVDDIEDDDDLDFVGQIHSGRESPIVSRQSLGKRTLPWMDQSDGEVEHVPQSPVQSSKRKTSSKTVQLQPDLAMHSIATHDFTTPKKAVRNSEIPSSQSPPSIRLSTQQSKKSQRHAPYQKSPSKSPSKLSSRMETRQRSPLKEKSVNIAPLVWQPETQESQNPTMKMLQQVRLRTKMGGAPLHEEPPMPPPRRPQRPAAEPSQPQMPTTTQTTSPRQLKRTNTVQDSQASDENIMTQAPPRNLTRTLTIQDSQHEDLDLSSQLYRSLSSRDNLRVAETQAVKNDTYDENEYDEEEGEEDYPHTFDPVSAALERDAARYAWTQTQALPTQHQPSRTQIADSEDEDESDEDDLDRGIVPDSDSDDEIILLPSPPAQRGPSQELCTDDLDVPTPKADKQSDQAPEIRQKENASPSPPSSPPPLRPSQVSTVLPTQSSPHRYLPAPAGEDDDFSPPTSPPAPSQRRLIKKPQPQQETQALTISSSPLPLPPWSSSGEMDLGLEAPPPKDEQYGENDLASLVDFSLPPPPPLGMSSSPWK